MPIYDLSGLREGLGVGWRLHFLSRCGSTNDVAGRMRREGRLYAPAIVVTPRQERGRGRGEKVWKSDSGTMTATFALPVDEGHPPHHLPLIAGVAVREACVVLLGETVAESVQLKWPNDVMIGGKKVAGLLCERVEGVDLVGVGLNVTTKIGRLPEAVRGRATSLELAGRKPTMTEVLLAVAAQLRKATEVREPFTAVLRRYDAHHLLPGKRVTIRPPHAEAVVGRCEGLDAQGRLLVRTARGVERVVSGMVEAWGTE